MSTESTENDAEIARILAEEDGYQPILYNSEPPIRAQSYSPPSLKNPHTNNVEQGSSSTFYEDSEMAYILQIEEIVLSENAIYDKTAKVTDVQLEKTHADMTKALKPTESTDLMTRILGMFMAIQTRYATCQTKNQILIDQIEKLSIQLYPMILSFKTRGKFGITNAAVPALATGLVSNLLQSNLQLSDAKEILMNMLQIWTDSNIWYEFLEQLVYILVAITVPSFAPGAIGKLMGKLPFTS